MGDTGKAGLAVFPLLAPHAVFLFGFAKNTKGNIAADDLAHLRLIGADLLAATQKAIEKAIADDELTEVHDE